MNFRVLEVVLSLALWVVAIVGVLVREHLHFLADGLCTTVLQADGTTGIFCIIIVVCVLQGKVLDIEVLASVKDGGCCADTLYLRLVDDDGLVHAFTDKRDVVSADGSQYGLAEIVCAVRQEYISTRCIGCGIVSADEFESSDKAFAIASLHCVPVTILGVGRLSHIDDAEAVDVVGTCTIEREDVLTAFI